MGKQIGKKIFIQRYIKSNIPTQHYYERGMHHIRGSESGHIGQKLEY
jgi:phage antirepressor YoqD-like protein